MIKAFLLGVYEFRRSFTSRVENETAYDWGRELAHIVTLRRYET